MSIAVKGRLQNSIELLLASSTRLSVFGPNLQVTHKIFPLTYD